MPNDDFPFKPGGPWKRREIIAAVFAVCLGAFTWYMTFTQRNLKLPWLQ